jgi:hypothetical protein
MTIRKRISNINLVQNHILRFKWFYLAGIIVIIGLAVFLSVYFTVINNSVSSGSIVPSTVPIYPTSTITPTPQPPAPGPAPGPGGMVQVQEWGGWATTTKDSEPPLWPGAGTPLSFDLQKILNHGSGNKLGSIKVSASGEVIDVIGTMGTAIPWALFSKIFGFKTRTEFLATVIDSCAGRNNIPCCILVQPINKYPDEIKPTPSTNSAFPMVNNLCTKNSDCMSINDPNITATYNSGTKYPAYLLVPFQGCGGDCSTLFPDCFNSCPDVQNVVANLNYYTQCGKTPANGCQQIKWLSDNNWIMTPEIEQQFYSNKNAFFAISEKSLNGRNMTAAAASSPNNGHINYCSGKNMHFDVQLLDGANPYWCNLAVSADPNNSISLPSNGSSTRGGPIDNTIVRYMLVPGNIFGNFNILADGDNPPKYPLPTPGCGGASGGSNRCGTGDWSKSICPNPTCSQTSDCTSLGQGFVDCYGASGCA